MVLRHSFLGLMAIAILWFGAAEAAAKYSTVRITLDNETDFQLVRSLGFSDLVPGAGYVDAILAPGDLERLQSAGLKYTITIDDMTAFYQSRLDPSRDMGGYRTLSEIELVLDSISIAHPDIVTSKWSIGNTIEGRPIWVVKISDNPGVDEDEPEVYYNAAHHAREVISPEVLIYFMRYLTNNYGTDSEVTYLVDNRELFFCLCVNPDGYHYNEEATPEGGGLWRNNRRDNGDGSFGVDINRNYGYQWGYDNYGSSPNPFSETYRGTAAFSEPETQAQRDFTNSRHFKVIASYHAFGDYFIYPWGYEFAVTPDHGIFSQMGDTVHAMSGFTAGATWQTLFYTVNGGATDWAYGEQTTKEKAYAFTCEVGNNGDGFWPATDRITTLVQNQIQPNLFYARIADNPEKLAAPVAPTIYAIGDVDTTYFPLYWHHFDQYNPAQAFEIWQMQNPVGVTDSLENPITPWIEDGFTLATASFHSNRHSYFSGNTDNIDTRLSTGQLLRVASGDTLRFWSSYNISSGLDYGYVEISVDGGSTWTSIPGSITTQDNPNGQNLGNGITGNSNGWKPATFPLTPFIGQEIEYRFRYVTDGSINNAGWYLDDIYPVMCYADSAKLTDSVTDTTLLVTGLGLGDFYYKVRAKDAQNQLSEFSMFKRARVSYNTQCPWAIADANNDAAIDIGDAVYLISYIFSGGSFPTPNAVGSGDADCSGTVDIGDAVYLIKYIFSGGPVPGATCDCKNY